MASESTFGWLHITDIHVGQPRESGRLTNIERVFLEDLSKVLVQEALAIRVIFLSGDIAYRGSEAEYIRATAVLGRICGHVHQLNQKLEPGAAPPVLIPVPGNHDLSRPSAAEAEAIRQALGSRTQHAPPLWSAGQEGVRALIEKCFAAYHTWLNTHPLPLPPGMMCGIVPGDLCATVARSGISVGIVGLNSSYLHLGDTQPGTLHLDLSQVVNLLGGSPASWLSSHHFNVLLMHHPPSWLSAVARTILDEEIKPDQLFDLHLYGHAHVGRLSTDPGTSGIRHLVEGRSLFGAEEDGEPRLHGYTLGRFVVGDSGAAPPSKRVELWTRQGWRDGHGWRFGPMDERWGHWRVVIDLGETVSANKSETPPPAFVPELGVVEAAAKTSGPWRIIDSPDQVGAALDAATGRRWLLLSASIPVAPDDPGRRTKERAHWQSGRPEAIRAFITELARQVFDRSPDLGIIFGGHPSATQILAPLALSAAGRGKWLALVQDEHYWHRFVEDVGVVVHAASIQPFLIKTSGAGPNLDALRAALLSPKNLAAAVFIGGLSGILEEHHQTRTHRPDVPCFAVGLGGGAAAQLLLDSSTMHEALGATAPGSPDLIQNPAQLCHTPELAVKAILDALTKRKP